MILKKLSKRINYRKVKDHCHYAGKYRSTAHSACKFKFNAPNKIIVLFHNGLNYALHKNWPHLELLLSGSFFFFFIHTEFEEILGISLYSLRIRENKDQNNGYFSPSDDYHFIIKILANNFEGQVEYLGENTEQYNFFPILIEQKVSNIDRDGNESIATISYKIIFVVNLTFMATPLSNLVDNLTEKIHKIKCKDCDCFLEYESVNDNLIKYR